MVVFSRLITRSAVGVLFPILTLHERDFLWLLSRVLSSDSLTFGQTGPQLVPGWSFKDWLLLTHTICTLSVQSKGSAANLRIVIQHSDPKCAQDSPWIVSIHTLCTTSAPADPGWN